MSCVMWSSSSCVAAVAGAGTSSGLTRGCGCQRRVVCCQRGHVVIPGAVRTPFLSHAAYDDLMYSGGNDDRDEFDGPDFDVDAVGRGVYTEAHAGGAAAPAKLSLYYQEQSLTAAVTDRYTSNSSIDPDAPRPAAPFAAVAAAAAAPGAASPKKSRRSSQRRVDDGVAYTTGWLFRLRCCVSAYYFLAVFFIIWMLAIKVGKGRLCCTLCCWCGWLRASALGVTCRGCPCTIAAAAVLSASRAHDRCTTGGAYDCVLHGGFHRLGRRRRHRVRGAVHVVPGTWACPHPKLDPSRRLLPAGAVATSVQWPVIRTRTLMPALYLLWIRRTARCRWTVDHCRQWYNIAADRARFPSFRVPISCAMPAAPDADNELLARPRAHRAQALRVQSQTAAQVARVSLVGHVCAVPVPRLSGALATAVRSARGAVLVVAATTSG